MDAGGGCGAEVFFTGGRYLMHEKVFSLGQVRIRFFTEYILPAFRQRC